MITDIDFVIGDSNHVTDFVNIYAVDIRTINHKTAESLNSKRLIFDASDFTLLDVFSGKPGGLLVNFTTEPLVTPVASNSATRSLTTQAFSLSQEPAAARARTVRDVLMPGGRSPSFRFWPEKDMFSETGTWKKVCAIANRLVRICKTDTDFWGGFPTLAVAEVSKSDWWRLAHVLFIVAPHRDKLQNRNQPAWDPLFDQVRACRLGYQSIAINA